ncbi:MAG: hypothetical protein KGZ89_04745 [Actinobacteria bacterium]|nr:hypothetical protein [Actinomycetota bacterium]
MMLVVWAVLAVLAIIYVVPFVVYGIASAFGGVELPQEVSPRRFLLGILLTKFGTAVAFVIVFWLTSAVWADRWLAYGAIWFVMFAASEIGEAVSGRTSAKEAVLGILSEAIYAPAAAFAAHAILTG